MSSPPPALTSPSPPAPLPPPPPPPPALPLPNPYFLASGGKSCTEACATLDEDYACDTDLITAAAANVSACKTVLDSLTVEYEHTGVYADDDSGCTYHPGQNGWAQVMNSGRDEGADPAPTCDEINADANRHRVCACRVAPKAAPLAITMATPSATSP